MQLTVKIAPMGAVRMTQRGKWVRTEAQRYLNYKAVIGYEARRVFRNPVDKPIRLKAVFTLGVPTSWTAKKTAAAYKGEIPPTVKPDADNLLKGLMDALNGIAWVDDKQVVEFTARKEYGPEAKITVEVEEIC